MCPRGCGRSASIPNGRVEVCCVLCPRGHDGFCDLAVSLGMPVREAISVDVMAYNDVVIHPAPHRDIRSLRELLDDREWTTDATDWTQLHAGYVTLYDRYSNDSDAIRYRDERRQRQTRMAERDRRTADREASRSRRARS